MHGTLWDFSLEIYARPEVASACLRCQDEAGADVNLILFLLWRTLAGHCLTEGDIVSVDEQVALWREQVVKPLRVLRRTLKSRSLDQSGAFREQIKAAELEAERIEQEALSRTVADSVRPTSQLAPGDAAQANLQAYAAVIGRSLPKQAVNALLEALGSFTERVSERCDQGQGLRRDHV